MSAVAGIASRVPVPLLFAPRLVIRSTALTLLVGGLLSGCAGPDRRLVGEWRGSRPSTGMQSPDDRLVRNITAVKLKLQRDGRFLLTDGGFPYEGQWSRSGDALDLKVITVLNQPLAKQGSMMKRAADFNAIVAGESLKLVDPNGIEITLRHVGTEGSKDE